MLHYFKELLNKDQETLKKIGKKAESLIRLTEWGIPVPDGFSLTVEAFEKFVDINKLKPFIEELFTGSIDNPERAVKELQERIMLGSMPKELETRLNLALMNFPDCSFAVRSSGTQEDLHETSFAGLYTTILNVKGIDETWKAIKQCWCSLFNTRVLNYCLNRKISFEKMKLAVVVQKMVHAEKSGVIFTVNPLKGYDREMIIEACFGLGEALVGGEVTPDQYFFDWNRQTECNRIIQTKKIALRGISTPPFIEKIELSDEVKNQEVLSPLEVRELASIALSIQAGYGFPVDIEWVKFNGKFYIVQSRPITMINYNGIEGEWTTADFKDGGVSSSVCSQFMWSLYDMVFETTMPSYLLKNHLIEKNIEGLWGNMFFGRPYWNLGAVKNGLKRIPGYVEKRFDEGIGVKTTYEGNGYVTKTNFNTIITGLKILWRLKKSFKTQMKFCPDFARKQKERLKELSLINPAEMNREDFFQFYEQFIKKDYFKSESSYFMLIYDNSNVATLFKDYLEKLKAVGNYIDLITGLSDISHLRQNFKLWNLSQKIKEDQKALKYWLDNTVPALIEDWKKRKQEYFMAEVTAYIEEFKYHSTRELDITVPRFGEDPSFIMGSLKNNLLLDINIDPELISKKQTELYENKKKKFLQGLPFYSRSKAERKIKEMRNFLWWREELRDLSTQFYYYVRLYTIVLADHFVEMGILNNRNDIFFLPIEDIFSVLNKNLEGDKISFLVKQNKSYYSSFRNFINPNEIGKRFHSITGKAAGKSMVLNGIPCSPGSVTAKVKVIKDIFDANRLEKGDILITKFTDPGWTAKFSFLAGVATETGGILSHAAVISREYGIPAVLAVNNLTTSLKDGQRVFLDGDKGTISLLEN